MRFTISWIPLKRVLSIGALLLLFLAALYMYSGEANATTDTDWFTPSQAVTQAVVDNYADNGTDTDLKTAINAGRHVIVLKATTGQCYNFIGSHADSVLSLALTSTSNITATEAGSGGVQYSNGSQACTDTGGSTNTSYTSPPTTSVNSGVWGGRNIAYMIVYNKDLGGITYFSGYTNTQHTAAEIGHRIPHYVPPVDLCSNLEGTQETIPEGYEDPDEDGVCTEIPVDLCTNLEGVQSEMPEGYEDTDEDGVCTEIVVPPTEYPPDGVQVRHIQMISVVITFGLSALLIGQFRWRGTHA